MQTGMGAVMVGDPTEIVGGRDTRSPRSTTGVKCGGRSKKRINGTMQVRGGEYSAFPSLVHPLFPSLLNE